MDEWWIVTNIFLYLLILAHIYRCSSQKLGGGLWLVSGQRFSEGVVLWWRPDDMAAGGQACWVPLEKWGSDMCSPISGVCVHSCSAHSREGLGICFLSGNQYLLYNPVPVVGIMGDTWHKYWPFRALRCPQMSCHHVAFRRNQIWARTNGPVSLSSTPIVSPCQGTKALGSNCIMYKQGKSSGKWSNDFHPHPFHPLPSCLVDSWPSQCGLGRLRKFSSRAPGSQEQELPQAISVPGSPSKGFLGRWERLWLVGCHGRGPIISDFWRGSNIQILPFPH